MKIKLNFYKPVILSLILLFLAGGCEYAEEYTINPDGSGKVVFETVFQKMELFGMEINGVKSKSEKMRPELELKKEVSDLLQSRGVEAWSGVEAKVLPDGRMWFKGTAYFKDYSQLELKTTGKGSFRMNFSKGQDKNLTLEQEKKGGHEEDGGKTSAKMTEEEISKKILQTKVNYQKIRPFVMGMLCSYKYQISFHLPGDIMGFENMDHNTQDAILSYTFIGQDVFEELDKKVKDEEWLRNKLNVAKLNLGLNGVDIEKLLEFAGMKPPARVVMAPPFKPLFDYNAEVSSAKLAYPQLLEKWRMPDKAPQAENKGVQNSSQTPSGH